MLLVVLSRNNNTVNSNTNTDKYMISSWINNVNIIIYALFENKHAHIFMHLL